MIFRPAIPDEALQIAAMINASYRGETSRQGWTTEADLLDGLRTSEGEVSQLIQSPYAMIMLCLKDSGQGSELMGSILMERQDDSVHVGMFVVQPGLQKQGIGKQLLAAAENAAKQRWAASKFSMMVITLRHELIAFYQRRGYRRTGIFKEFPVNPEIWRPKVEGLLLEKLEKP